MLAIVSAADAVDAAVTAEMIRSAFAIAAVALDASVTSSRAARAPAAAAQRASSISMSNAVTAPMPACMSAAPKIAPTSPYPIRATRIVSIAGSSLSRPLAFRSSFTAAILPPNHRANSRRTTFSVSSVLPDRV